MDLVSNDRTVAFLSVTCLEILQPSEAPEFLSMEVLLFYLCMDLQR